MKPASQGDDDNGDPRVAAIVTVGWVSLAMLGICIPLTAVLAPISVWVAAGLPVLVILGAGSMMARIWFADDVPALPDEEKADPVQERLEELEARLGNLEAVDSLEAHFARKNRGPSATGLPSSADDQRAPEPPQSAG